MFNLFHLLLFYLIYKYISIKCKAIPLKILTNHDITAQIMDLKNLYFFKFKKKPSIDEDHMSWIQ